MLLINSLPKSGTNLVSKMADLVGMAYSGKSISSGSLYGRHGVFKRVLRGCKFSECIDIGLDFPALASRRWVMSVLGCLDSSSYLTGHLPFNSAIKDLLDEKKCKIIHVVRDPRDVLVSWTHYVRDQPWHFAHEALSSVKFEQAIRLVLRGFSSCNCKVLSFKDILARSMGWLTDPSVKVIRFEELVGERGGGDRYLQAKVIESFISFIEIAEASSDKIASCLYGGTHTFRKGQIGGWSKELSPFLLSEIKEELSSTIRHMGYE